MRETGFESTLKRAEEGDFLSESEVAHLLSLPRGEEREALFSAARRVRARSTGDTVFLYGFIYLSSFCRNDCHFCFFRKSNVEAPRYRKSRDQVVQAARVLAASGVHLIDLTMGEDPAYFVENDFGDLADQVASVAGATGLPVMVSPGLVDEGVLKILRDSGATWYACYQETHDRALFEKIRPKQDFDDRIAGKKMARRLGFLTEEGMLSGLGESQRDVARTIVAMGEVETDQVRVMSFVPQKGTPLRDSPPGESDQEMKIIAVMRLLFPDRLIPASLDIGGLGGLKDRLNAGANVITSLVPPGQGLSGVAQASLDIDDARRTVAGVEPVLRDCGLTSANRAEYHRWIDERMDKNRGA